MKKYLLICLLFALAAVARAADGDVFTAKTVEGVEMKFKVISEAEKTCQVGPYDSSLYYATECRSIDAEVTGTVTIPSYANGYKVVSIAGYAFYRLIKLTQVVIPETVKDVYFRSFIWCTRLESVDLSHVGFIGTGAFYGCSKLERVSIGSGCSSIGSEAFASCPDIKEVHIVYNGSTDIFSETLPADAFDEEVYQNATLYVPTGSKDRILHFAGWKKFQNIVEEGEAITLATDDIWWGYFTESDVNASNYRGVGNSEIEDFEAAIYVPENHPIVGGADIKAVRIWFGSTVTALTKLKLWISPSLTEYASGAYYTQDVDVSTLVEGANDIVLNTPWPVDGRAFYVGYTLGISSAVNPIMGGGTWVENSYFIRCVTNVPDWDAYDRFGKLAMQLQLDGIELPYYAVMPSDFGSLYVQQGETASTSMHITNLGQMPVNSIGYTVTTDGITSEEKRVTFSSLGFGESRTVTIRLDADAVTGRHDKLLTVTTVCDEPNEASTKTAQGCLLTLRQKPVPVPVVEEFTGTWCGYCPNGIEGMKAVHAEYGDQVVLIAVHKSDIMETADYRGIETPSGYPGSRIDRELEAYPTARNLRYDIDSQLSRTTVGSVKATAVWTSDEQTAVRIDTRTLFEYDDYAGDYALAYVLLEDGMHGTGSGWAQVNFMSGDASYKESMPEWYAAPSRVSGLEFDHVAVAAWSIVDGVEGSVPTRFKAGEDLAYSFNADISSNSLIQDKSRLKAVVLLLDRATGGIVNAAQTEIKDYTTGIESLSQSEAVRVDYYTLDGAKVQSPVKGLYIRRTTDAGGRTVSQKVLMP
jgi:thiol-disulfide isomerase/thioredoxin